MTDSWAKLDNFFHLSTLVCRQTILVVFRQVTLCFVISPFRIFGVTTLDIVRSNTFVSELKV